MQSNIFGYFFIECLKEIASNLISSSCHMNFLAKIAKILERFLIGNYFGTVGVLVVDR